MARSDTNTAYSEHYDDDFSSLRSSLSYATSPTVSSSSARPSPSPMSSAESDAAPPVDRLRQQSSASASASTNANAYGNANENGSTNANAYGNANENVSTNANAYDNANANGNTNAYDNANANGSGGSGGVTRRSVLAPPLPSCPAPNSVLLHVSKVTAVEQLDPEPTAAHRRRSGGGKKKSFLEETPCKGTLKPSSRPSHSHFLDAELNDSDKMAVESTARLRLEAKEYPTQEESIRNEKQRDGEMDEYLKKVKHSLTGVGLDSSPGNGNYQEADCDTNVTTQLTTCIPTSQKGGLHLEELRCSQNFPLDRKNDSLGILRDVSPIHANEMKNGVHFPPLFPFSSHDTSRDNNFAEHPSPVSINRADLHSRSTNLGDGSPQVWKRHVIMRGINMDVVQRACTATNSLSRSGVSSRISQDNSIISPYRVASTGCAPATKLSTLKPVSEFLPSNLNQSIESPGRYKNQKSSKRTSISPSPTSQVSTNVSTQLSPRSSSYSLEAHVENGVKKKKKKSTPPLTRAELLLQIKELKRKLAEVRKDKPGSKGRNYGSRPNNRNGARRPESVGRAKSRAPSEETLRRLRRENEHLRKKLKKFEGEELSVPRLMRMAEEDLKHAQEELKELKKRKAALVSEDRRASIMHRQKAKLHMTQEELRAQQHRDGLYSRAVLESKVDEMREKLENMKSLTPQLMQRIEDMVTDTQRRGLSDISPEEYTELKTKVDKNLGTIKKLKNTVSVHMTRKSLTAIDKVSSSSEEDLSQVVFPSREEMEKVLRKLIRQVEKKEKQIQARRSSIGADVPERTGPSSRAVSSDKRRSAASSTHDHSHSRRESCFPVSVGVSESRDAPKSSSSLRESRVSPRRQKSEEKLRRLKERTGAKKKEAGEEEEQEQEEEEIARERAKRDEQSDEPRTPRSQRISNISAIALSASRRSSHFASKSVSFDRIDLSSPLPKDILREPSRDGALEALRRRVAAANGGGREETDAALSESATSQAESFTKREKSWLSPSILALDISDHEEKKKEEEKGEQDEQEVEEEEEVIEDIKSDRSTPVWLRV